MMFSPGVARFTGSLRMGLRKYRKPFIYQKTLEIEIVKWINKFLVLKGGTRYTSNGIVLPEKQQRASGLR
jgi:hypothetical protein